MTILVVKPGSLTLIEDLGRPGHAHLAVPRSGAADRPACIRANRMVGNPDGAAVLEMTLLGATLRFEADALVALTGADMGTRLDGAPVAVESSVAVRTGQLLACGAALRGVRGYLAVAGGIEATPLLGSCSHDVMSGLGPAPLRAGERLAVGAVRGIPRGVFPPPVIAGAPALYVKPGPRDDWFVPVALRELAAAPYIVSPDSNRIAVRLKGAVLARSIHDELPSEGLVPGAIQVPADGQPVVMLADHPTTGGYPVIGVVLPEDLWMLAQARPGSEVRFAVAS
ncbi:MAG: biotin-dependent carboxyltransferase family protein [Nevskiaceae bacterium]